MRLFIAIHPDPDWIRHLTGCQHQLVQAGLQGRLVPEENLHMTLAFPGNCTQDQKDTILHLLQTLSFPATDARCLGYHRFGNLDRLRSSVKLSCNQLFLDVFKVVDHTLPGLMSTAD
jgi:2'-5' RNA ligase